MTGSMVRAIIRHRITTIFRLHPIAIILRMLMDVALCPRSAEIGGIRGGCDRLDSASRRGRSAVPRRTVSKVIKKRSSSHHPGARRWKSRFLVIKKRYRRGKEPEASDAVAASGCKAGRKCLTTQARERQKQAKEEPFLARIKSRNEK